MTASLLTEIRTSLPPPPPPDTARLLVALAEAHGLVERAESRAVALALDAIGDLTLPDAVPATADDQALIRALAPLYLAAQLEEAELITTVETLSGLAVSGGLQRDLGAAVPLVRAFWQARHDRFSVSERRALFARVFGSDDPGADAATTAARPAPNAAFEDLMIDLTEALYKLDEESLGGNTAGPRALVRVLFAARGLAANLLQKGGGMTVFAAREIVGTIQSAVEILQQPEVQRAVHARSLWTAVRAVSRRYLRRDRDPSPYVARGKSGLTVLSWLADSLPLLSDDRTRIALDHPVIAAATEWLQASLTIRETGARVGA